MENASSRTLKENCLDRCPAEKRSKLFSVMRARFALSEARERPLVLEPMVKRGAQPDAGMRLAGLNNSRCDSLIGCYGISERPFIALDNLCESFS
jgi:hypothetical protein